MASHSIAFSSSLLSDARRLPSTQNTHSAPFNPVAVRLKPPIAPPDSVACVCGWLAGKGGQSGCERGRGGRLLEVIEIMTIEVKMLKEKVLSDIGWTSAADFQMDILANYPAVCGST